MYVDHDVAVFDDKLWIFGGCFCRATTPEEIGTDGNMNDVWFSSNGSDWQELLGTPWSLRHACGVFSVPDNGCFLAGGNAVTFSDEERDKTLADRAANPNAVVGQYKAKSAWLPFDVWRLVKLNTVAGAKL